MERHYYAINQAAKFLPISGNDRQTLIETGHCTIIPKKDWPHDCVTEWHIAQRIWKCGFCGNAISEEFPYWTIRFSDDEGQHTSTYCATCAIHEFEALTK